MLTLKTTIFFSNLLSQTAKERKCERSGETTITKRCSCRLDLFKKVPNLRVLACGGDGTVGWVLSILDQIGAYPPPAVGVLPLGTGNDLARALGWGGGYTDEPIGKILTSIGDSETTLLDRWQLEVERNQDAQNDDDGNKGKENLPLNVVNNYFSLGVDAHIALEFHEARGEA